jgi:hypothetical protein
MLLSRRLDKNRQQKIVGKMLSGFRQNRHL